VRMPVVAGVAGGVGTTTIAAALRGDEGDLYVPGDQVDVLVCRSTTDSLGETHKAVASTPYPPVLAVVGDIPAGCRGMKLLPNPVRARLRMVEPYVAGFVAIPFVPTWRERDEPVVEAYHVLAPTSDVPRELRDFAEAAQRLAELLVPLLTEHPQPMDPARV
jgi:hypothetical protein